VDHQNGDQSYTPYAPPTADIGFGSVGGEAHFIPGGQSVPAGNALTWISDSWGLFKRKPGMWIGFVLFLFVIQFLLDRVPYFLGSIVFYAVQIFLIAGVIYSCDLLRREGSFSFGDLFIGFQRKTAPLLTLVLIAFGFFLGLMLIAFIFLGTGVLMAMSSGDPVAMASAFEGVGAGALFVGAIIFLVGTTIYAMTVWFAPALVLMHDIAPFQALKMSFFACLKNILPGIVFFIVMIVLVIVSAIPLGLGLLVTMPMLFICYYTSYNNIFLSEEN